MLPNNGGLGFAAAKSVMRQLSTRSRQPVARCSAPLKSAGKWRRRGAGGAACSRARTTRARFRRRATACARTLRGSALLDARRVRAGVRRVPGPMAAMHGMRRCVAERWRETRPRSATRTRRARRTHGANAMAVLL
eukprot:IDg12854t1